MYYSDNSDSRNSCLFYLTSLFLAYYQGRRFMWLKEKKSEILKKIKEFLAKLLKKLNLSMITHLFSAVVSAYDGLINKICKWFDSRDIDNSTLFLSIVVLSGVCLNQLTVLYLILLLF